MNATSKIFCHNCGRKFVKFNFSDPFQNHCEKCIKNLWYISDDLRKELLSKAKKINSKSKSLNEFFG